VEFDLVSYVAGIIATVVASITVALFIQWVQTKGIRDRVKKSLFSEIEHNQKIVKGLLGDEASYLSQHWSYFPMPFSKSNFENAKQSGFLYNLRPEAYERISEAYDIIYLIDKEKYGPTGTARNTFEKLEQILKDIIEKYISN
jgi:hypothetical protein